MFKELVHEGTELKQHKAIRPHSKKADISHYHDLVRQNEWLRLNVFDSLGNYLYCCFCIRAALGVSKDSLTRQHAIKRKQSQFTIIELCKAEVEELSWCLCCYASPCGHGV